MASAHTATGCNNTPGVTNTVIGTGTLDVSKMANTSVDSSIPSDSAVYDEAAALPGGVVVAPPSPDGDAIPGDAAPPADSDSTNATAAPLGDAITLAAEDNTCHGRPYTYRIIPLIPSWKTYIWLWLFMFGQALLAIFAASLFYLSQSSHSIISYIGMLFIFILVHDVTVFLYFALTHLIQYLKDKFSNTRADSIIDVTIVIIYCTIIIVSSELDKPDLSLCVHFVFAICSSNFMALLTYVFDEDVGKTRTKITLQALACMLYYFQQNKRIYILFYLVPSTVGYLTLIIGGDGPVESINMAFLRIVSFAASVPPNYEDSHLRSILCTS